MYDKLEKHNNHKFAYRVSRRVNSIKSAVYSFFKSEAKTFNSFAQNNYLLSTKK